MKTAMQELKGMIEKMTQNGGDYDLLCVLVLIEDRFLKEEKHQIIDAYKDFDHDMTAEQYYNKTFKNN